jgi:tetratricopeptide (TPR) repeat protein
VDSSIDLNGTLDAKIRLEDRGDTELVLRLAYRFVPQNRWQELTQKIVAGMGFGGTVSDVSIAQPENTTEPFWITVSYHRTDYPDWKKHLVILPVPAIFTPGLNEEQKVSKDPLPLGPLQDIIYEATMKFPPGFVPVVPKKVEDQRDFAQFTATFSIEGGALHAIFHLETFLREIPGTERAKYSGLTTDIDETSRRYIPIATVDLAHGPTSAAKEVKIPGRKEASQPASNTAHSADDHPEAAEGSLDTKPHLAQALYEAARRAETNGDYAGGARILEQVVQKDPKHKAAWNYLGWTYNKLGRYEKAEAALRNALALDPTAKFVHNNLGEALAGQKKYIEAIPEYEKEIEINPKDRWAHANLGRVYVLADQYDKAIPELETAATITPDDPAIYFNMGRAYGKTGQLDKAVKQFGKSVDHDPIPSRWNAVAYEMALENLGLDQAQRYAEKAIEATNARTRGMSLDHLSNEDAWLPAALAAYWDTLGWVKLQQGNSAEAEKYVRSAWQVRSIGEIGDHLGQIYEKEGRKAEATEAYSLALAANQPMPGTKARLVALLGSDADVDRLTKEAARNFAEGRTIRIKNTHAVDGIAEFWILLSPGPKVRGVKFISGDEALRPFICDLEAATFPESFPDTTDVRLLRRGKLTCLRTSGACSFLFMSAETVRSAN